MTSTDGPHIGTLNEGALHAALKMAYAQPGDEFEVPLNGFVIDIVRENQHEQRLIEIQTGSFGAMGNKLDHLLAEHKILLVYPVAVETILDKKDASPRRSPKRGSIYSLFDELVSIPTLLDHPNLSLDVVLASVTKLQIPDPRARRGRGGYRTVDRRLNHVIETHHFDGVTDMMRLLPDGLPPVFTTADIASAARIPKDAAQKLAYCFRATGLFDELGRTRKGIQYQVTDAGAKNGTRASSR